MTISEDYDTDDVHIFTILLAGWQHKHMPVIV